MRSAWGIVAVCILFFLPAASFGQLCPTVKWLWTGSSTLPDYRQVDVTPLVVSLNDDNSDGYIDENDYPDIVFSSYAGLHTSVLRAVDGRNGHELFSSSDHLLKIGANLAAGDIDSDGRVEIVGWDWSAFRLLAFENDGSYKWASDTIDVECIWGGPAIADLDQDGDPEIIMGRTVFDSKGAVLWEGEYGAGKNGMYGPLSCVSNLDMSGGLELLAGNCAYHSDGSLYWQKSSESEPNYVGPALDDGFPAVGNFDTDSFPEIVLVSAGRLYVLEHDGMLKTGPVLIPGALHSDPRYPGGPPTVYDFDADGCAEIGIVSPSHYTVFEADGSILWSFPINESSSGVTGSTVFDLDGDLVPEAIQSDHDSIRVFNASNGEVLWSTGNSSHTATEFPVVADVDNDGSSEVIVVANGDSINGVKVLGDPLTGWVGSRSIWNQHTYHITNVNNDGSLPTVESPNWSVYNSFRCQPAGVTAVEETERRATGAAPISLSISPNPFSSSTAITVSQNAGRPGHVLEIEIFDCLGRVVRSFSLARNEAARSELTWDGADMQGSPLPAGVYVIVAGSEGSESRAKTVIVR